MFRPMALARFPNVVVLARGRRPRLCGVRPTGGPRAVERADVGDVNESDEALDGGVREHGNRPGQPVDADDDCVSARH